MKPRITWELAQKTYDKVIHVQPIDQIKVYSNTFVPSAVISYTLVEPAMVKLEIKNVSTHKNIRELVFIPGNPGGRQGENKIFWDGCDFQGKRVAYDNFQVKFYVNNIDIGLEVALNWVDDVTYNTQQKVVVKK